MPFVPAPPPPLELAFPVLDVLLVTAFVFCEPVMDVLALVEPVVAVPVEAELPPMLLPALFAAEFELFVLPVFG